MLSQLKPYLTALIMPPMSLILMILMGLLLGFSKKHVKKAKALTTFGVLALALLSSTPISVWLSEHLLPPTQELQWRELQRFNPGAIVILGGGIEPPTQTQEAQLNSTTLDRLRYAVYLHRQTSLPMLFSGGQGWGAISESPSEAAVCQRVAKEVFGVELKWLESQSRDTEDNAINSYQMLHQEGIHKIVLVSSAWHMPRSIAQFKAAGFEVLPAPMGPIALNSNTSLAWIPSAEGLKKSSTVLREALGLQVMRLKTWMK